MDRTLQAAVHWGYKSGTTVPWEPMTRKSTTTFPPMPAPQTISVVLGESTLELHGRGGAFFDQRTLGYLRDQLVSQAGSNGAQMSLTRFGYVAGWWIGDAIRGERPGETFQEMLPRGLRRANEQGFMLRMPEAEQGSGLLIHQSWEAKQKLLRGGPAPKPACWCMSGVASGMYSALSGRPCYAIERSCVAVGDDCCRLEIRSVEDWGDEITPFLHYFLGEEQEEALALLDRSLAALPPLLPPKAKDTAVPAGMIANSAALQQVLELAERAAKVDVTVLLTGPSGVGKERIARFIHDRSERSNGPFVAVHCGAIPENLLEAEIFGWVRGAFPGATQDHPGLFESASGGTLLIHEIADLPLLLQVKLLRVLQSREIRRLGDTRPRRVDVRVIAATNVELEREVRIGKFRDDLFYRVRVVELRIPPLGERDEDILPLARHFVDAAARRMRRNFLGISRAAADRLVAYPWPGNVRELENAMERAVALAQGDRIEIADLPDPLRLSEIGEGPTSTLLEDVERNHILKVLAGCGGNQTRAAELLGIGSTTLYRKLKEYRYRTIPPEV